MGVEKIIGYVFFLFCIGYILHITNKHKVSLWNAIIGDDKKLDITELAALFWFMLFPMLFFAEVFLGMVAGEHIWYSLDSIFLIIIGGDVANKKIKKDKTNGSDRMGDDKRSEEM